MNETPQYPNGIEYRPPRPRGALAGVLLGGLLGYALGKNAESTIGGGLIGSALMNQPMPLHQAVRQTLTEKGLQVINFYRLGRFGAKVLFLYQGRYWTLESHASENPPMTTGQIEDWLYGDLILKAEDFIEQNNLRLHP